MTTNPDPLLAELIRDALNPAMALLPPAWDTPAARRFVLCAVLQESRGVYRFQLPRKPGGTKGPARGLAQFEENGGVKGVLEHPASAGWARTVCAARKVTPTKNAVWARLETDDVLAMAFARLLLRTDPKAVPTTAQAGWEAYADRLWRPGSPHRDTWDGFWLRAGYAVGLEP